MRGILVDELGVRHDGIDRNGEVVMIVVVTSVCAVTVSEVAFSERGMGIAKCRNDTHTHRPEASIDLASREGSGDA